MLKGLMMTLGTTTSSRDDVRSSETLSRQMTRLLTDRRVRLFSHVTRERLLWE